VVLLSLSGPIDPKGGWVDQARVGVELFVRPAALAKDEIPPATARQGAAPRHEVRLTCGARPGAF
jgi:hypothetical protein